MARAFVNSLQVVATHTADEMQLNMGIGYWGPDLPEGRVVENVVAAIIRFDDSLPNVRNKIAAVILNDAANLGISLVSNDIILPDFQKG